MKQIIAGLAMVLGITFVSASWAKKISLEPTEETYLASTSGTDRVLTLRFTIPTALETAKITKATLRFPAACEGDGNHVLWVEPLSAWPSTWEAWSQNRATNPPETTLHAYIEGCSDGVAAFNVGSLVRDTQASGTMEVVILDPASSAAWVPDRDTESVSLAIAYR